jgi:hypothetical protein
MSPTEKKIVDMLVIRAVAQGYLVSVFDGEAWPVKRSQHCDTILENLGHAEMETVKIRYPAGNAAGSVHLIYNGGDDVIADHTDNVVITTLVAEAMELAGHA